LLSSVLSGFPNNISSVRLDRIRPDFADFNDLNAHSLFPFALMGSALT